MLILLILGISILLKFRFDFFIVCCSILDILINNIKMGDKSNINSMIKIVKVFRVARILKLIKNLKGIQRLV